MQRRYTIFNALFQTASYTAVVTTVVKFKIRIYGGAGGIIFRLYKSDSRTKFVNGGGKIKPNFFEVVKNLSQSFSAVTALFNFRLSLPLWFYHVSKVLF